MSLYSVYLLERWSRIPGSAETVRAKQDLVCAVETAALENTRRGPRDSNPTKGNQGGEETLL